MSDRDQINRRDFIVTTAGAAGSASALAGATLTPAQAQTSPPPGFADQPPFAKNWAKPLREVVQVDLSAAAPELANEAVRERHRIYCHLLMKLMVRFWNGNKRGPLGSYPRRVKQMEAVQPAQPTQRYRGDMIADPDRLRNQAAEHRPRSDADVDAGLELPHAGGQPVTRDDGRHQRGGASEVCRKFAARHFVEGRKDHAGPQGRLGPGR